jgi:hypothetical protein
VGLTLVMTKAVGPLILPARLSAASGPMTGASDLLKANKSFLDHGTIPAPVQQPFTFAMSLKPEPPNGAAFELLSVVEFTVCSAIMLPNGGRRPN